jgi:hypothetical protein
MNDWQPACICGNDPQSWRHRSDCPLRYWHEVRDAEARIRELEATLRRVDTALDQTSAVLWKSLKVEVKSVLGSSAETGAQPLPMMTVPSATSPTNDGTKVQFTSKITGVE